MKLIDKFESIFNTKQESLLEKLLFKKIGEGSIRWKDLFTEELKKRLPNLINGLKLNRVISRTKVNTNSIQRNMEDIEITLASLAAEAEDIQNKISHHEMFRKDTVNIYFDISQDLLNVFNNEIKDYKTNNVIIKDGIIELYPTTLVDFPVKNVSVEYFPDNYLDKTGNDPTPENLIPGTDENYWLTEVVTGRRTTVGAYVILGFNGQVNFNILQLATSGKYPVRVSKVEIKVGTTWQEIDVYGDKIGKYITLTTLDDSGNASSYTTSYIRLTLIQDKPDFIWERTINNENEALITPSTEKTNILTNYIYKDEFALFKEQTIKNIYSYIFGLYFTRVINKSYDGDSIGHFYSKKFTNDKRYRYIEIKSEEYVPSPYTIEYKLIQHDGTYANVTTDDGLDAVAPNKRLALDNTFQAIDSFSNKTGNTILLEHFPERTNFICSKNGKDVRLVSQFDDRNDDQVIILNNVIYFNKSLTLNDIINIRYIHYSDSIIIHAILKTNTTYHTTDTPKLLSLDLEQYA